MTDLTNLTVALTWLAGIGGPYLVGKLVSYLAENWAKWHTFPVPVKFLAPMIASVLISVGATLLLGQVDFLEQLSPWYTMVALSIVSYLGTQKGYMETRVANYGRKASAAALQIPK